MLHIATVQYFLGCAIQISGMKGSNSDVQVNAERCKEARAVGTIVQVRQFVFVGHYLRRHRDVSKLCSLNGIARSHLRLIVTFSIVRHHLFFLFCVMQNDIDFSCSSTKSPSVHSDIASTSDKNEQYHAPICPISPSSTDGFIGTISKNICDNKLRLLLFFSISELLAFLSCLMGSLSFVSSPSDSRRGTFCFE